MHCTVLKCITNLPDWIFGSNQCFWDPQTPRLVFQYCSEKVYIGEGGIALGASSPSDFEDCSQSLSSFQQLSFSISFTYLTGYSRAPKILPCCRTQFVTYRIMLPSPWIVRKQILISDSIYQALVCRESLGHMNMEFHLFSGAMPRFRSPAGYRVSMEPCT